MENERPDLDQNFMDIAHVVSQRSTCKPGRQHGCVIVLDNRYVISTGYNGPMAGSASCSVVCSWPESCPSVHAEVNAIINAARVGVDFSRCIAYCTKQPCDHCFAVLTNAGVKHIRSKEKIKPGGNASRTFFPKEKCNV